MNSSFFGLYGTNYSLFVRLMYAFSLHSVQMFINERFSEVIPNPEMLITHSFNHSFCEELYTVLWICGKSINLFIL